ncbi:hypothetical protein BaRGS_00000292 [Batillaria attramentaria]|uniref:Hydroxylysine kinase n=1 Tax=Batillaria attramentaria TaxID=370345 RepID=A0ABD0MD62_9CAEN
MSENDNSDAKLFRPQLSSQTVATLTRRLYGLHVLTSRELDSYDDRNFHITVDDNDVQNAHLEALWPHGYVLKVLNSLDSKEPEVIKAKCDIILHAYRKGFPTPRPVPSTSGQLYALETLAREQPNDTGGGDTVETDVYLVRLFEFLPGTTLASVELTPTLAFQVGHYAAMLDNSLKDFDDSGCPELVVGWNMQTIPSLRNKLHAIKDPEKVKVVAEVIGEWEKILNRVIHSDFNDHNILVQSSVGVSSPSSSSLQEMDVCGILDFGDATKSLLIVEVAVAMTYMTVRCPVNFDPDKMAGHVLAGYLSEVRLPRSELQSLPITVCARFSQSLTVGHYKLSLDPENSYIMVHADKVWPHLHRLWSRPRDDTLDIWKSVVEDHGVTFPGD